MLSGVVIGSDRIHHVLFSVPLNKPKEAEHMLLRWLKDEEF